MKEMSLRFHRNELPDDSRYPASQDSLTAGELYELVRMTAAFGIDGLPAGMGTLRKRKRTSQRRTRKMRNNNCRLPVLHDAIFSPTVPPSTPTSSRFDGFAQTSHRKKPCARCWRTSFLPFPPRTDRSSTMKALTREVHWMQTPRVTSPMGQPLPPSRLISRGLGVRWEAPLPHPFP